MIWDTGEFELIPRPRAKYVPDTDDEASDEDVERSSSGIASGSATPQKLREAFQEVCDCRTVFKEL